MTRTRTTALARIARRAAVPALAALSLAAAASPALADDTAVNLDPTASITAAGQLTVSGTYQCDPSVAPYAQIAVSASGSDLSGDEVDASGGERVACTGSPQPWEKTLTPDQASATFAPGPAGLDVTAWTPGNWDCRADLSESVSAS